MTWTDIQVAPEKTYHWRSGKPIYQCRFDQVMKFHAPGLAPVVLDGESWHIHVDGKEAYRRRFKKTFGFYDGLAAVENHNGWHHILPSGEDLYSERYSWCGNYQEALCPVRNHRAEYFHLDKNGVPAYQQCWGYVGDFRDGIAVVQDSRGLSTHINRQGGIVHGHWFQDLDVFHKGFARARDRSGWMHIDLAGQELYAHRFTMVEPFYNGQARVETTDGALILIDESGEKVAELRPPTKDLFHELSADLVGFWKTEVLSVATRLSLFDLLPLDTEDVAHKTGLTSTGAQRLLNALGELALVGKNYEGIWTLTAKGEYLRHEHPTSLVDAVIETGSYGQDRWGHLESALKTDCYKPDDIFKEVASDQARLGRHHRMLQSYARHDYAELVSALPISAGDIVVDAGGGTGALAQLISETFPGSDVCVADLPSVVEAVSIPNVKTRGIDFFEPWLLSVDVIALARVLHDWPNECAIKILKNARICLKPGGRIVVIDMIRPEKGYAGSLCDLHLLVMTGGHERCLTEWQDLFAQSGFKISEILERQGIPAVLIGVPSV